MNDPVSGINNFPCIGNMNVWFEFQDSAQGFSNNFNIALHRFAALNIILKFRKTFLAGKKELISMIANSISFNLF
jgi:hypothetical protein